MVYDLGLTPLSTGAVTKATKKAYEALLGPALEPQDNSSKATEHGNMYEELAVRHFEEASINV